MKCRGGTWHRRVLPPVALYGLIGGFSGVTPHNHGDRDAGSDQRINTFDKPRDGLLGDHLPYPIRSTSVKGGAQRRQSGISTISDKMRRCSNVVALSVNAISPVSGIVNGECLIGASGLKAVKV